MEQRLATQQRACDPTSDSRSADVASARPRPPPNPLRSQGDFLTEAHAAAPAAPPPAAKVADRASSQAETPGSEREHLQQLLEELRAYGVDPQNGLSLERREALRVLLRHERQLDLMNPWGEH